MKNFSKKKNQISSLPRLQLCGSVGGILKPVRIGLTA